MAKDLEKIGIIGLGPVGMILSVHLKEAGHEVAICDMDKIKINLIQREGIRLEGILNKHAFFERVYTSIPELAEQNLDLMILAVKTHQMAAALDEAIVLKRDDLFVLSAQNGIDVEQFLGSVFGDSRTMRMVVNFAGNLNAPNVVKVTFFNPPNYVASIDDTCEDVAKQLAGCLNKVNLETRVVDSFEIVKRSWEKTILNSSLSALCGIGKLTMKEAMDMPDTVEIIEQVIEEAVEVAGAEKIQFEDAFIRKCLRYLKRAGSHFPSLAVDLINNRPTEIDHFNGKIVEYGRKHYIRTSLNLAFTNMVKAITHKNLLTQLAATAGGGNDKPVNLKIPSRKTKKVSPNEDYYLGIDLGSAYIKFTVIDSTESPVFQTSLQTVNRDRIAVKHVLQTIFSDFPVKYTCATGYGRKQFPDADILKTEVICAAAGGSNSYPGAKTIIDIGGEDIKVIRCDENNNVENFYLNNKCAAGTGSFITEIAERAGIEIADMSNFAAKSQFSEELNSFCTVFAKTEIMGWLFDGVSIEDISRGIYISIANRVSKLRVDLSVPIYLVGGVIAHHTYLKDMLTEKFKNEVQIIGNPVYVVSLGAALIAKRQYRDQQEEVAEEEVSASTQ